jgi:hypothetical protein
LNCPESNRELSRSVRYRESDGRAAMLTSAHSADACEDELKRKQTQSAMQWSG